MFNYIALVFIPLISSMLYAYINRRTKNLRLNLKLMQSTTLYMNGSVCHHQNYSPKKIPFLVQLHKTSPRMMIRKKTNWNLLSFLDIQLHLGRPNSPQPIILGLNWKTPHHIQLVSYESSIIRTGFGMLNSKAPKFGLHYGNLHRIFYFRLLFILQHWAMGEL